VTQFLSLLEIYPVTSPPDYEDTHKQALSAPNEKEAPIVGLLKSWLMYADQYRNQFGKQIGEDEEELGRNWKGAGKAIVGLTGGQVGRLHRNTLRAVVEQALSIADFEPDEDLDDKED
jgi:hypothetical protein